MKIKFLYLLIFICGFKTYSQEKKYFSIEMDVNYYYYFLGENNTNNFNYGLSIIVSKYINKLKISSGLNYSIKSYDSDGDDFFLIKKREYKLDYLNFPILSNIEIINRKSFNSSILFGFIFNKILDYNIKSYYFNEKTLNNNINENKTNLGTTLNLGLTYSKITGKKWQLNISPFINYILIPDHYNGKPQYTNFPDDRFSLGLKMGIEYLCKKNDAE